MKFPTRSTLIAAVCVPLLFASGTSALAAEDHQWSDAGAQLFTFMQSNGSPEDEAEAVVERFEQGILPDSMTGVSEPITSFETEVDNGRVVVSKYADDSITVTGYQTSGAEFEIPGAPEVDSDSGAVSQRAIVGCRSSSGSGYRSFRDCAVSGSNGAITIGFHVNYTLVQGGYDYISRTYSPFQGCSGAVCDTPYLSAEDKKEDSRGRGWSRYYARYTIAGASSGTARLWLYVGRNGASTSFSAKIG